MNFSPIPDYDLPMTNKMHFADFKKIKKTLTWRFKWNTYRNQLHVSISVNNASHMCSSYMKMALLTSFTQHSSPVVAVFLCWISKFSFLIPLSYQQHMGKIEFLGFLKFTGLIQRSNLQPWLLNNSNLSRHTHNPAKPASLV